MADLNPVLALMAVVRGLDIDINELKGHIRQASADRRHARESNIDLKWFDFHLGLARYGIPRPRREDNDRRIAKANAVKIIRTFMYIFADNRHQLPEGVLSTAVESLSGPVAWNATPVIFLTLLRSIRALVSNLAYVEQNALIRLRGLRARLPEACRLRRCLRCTCRRLQHMV